MKLLLPLLLALAPLPVAANTPRPPATQAALAGARALVAELPLAAHFEASCSPAVRRIAGFVLEHSRVMAPPPPASPTASALLDQLMSERIQAEVRRLLPEAAAAAREPLALHYAYSLTPEQVEALRLFYAGTGDRLVALFHVSDSRTIEDLVRQEIWRLIAPRLPAFSAQAAAEVRRRQRLGPLVPTVYMPGDC